MILTKGLTRLGAAVGLFALVFGLSAALASTTHAQNPGATFYGTASAGDAVEAWVGDTSCGAAATAGADGFWQMEIAEDAACSPTDGDTVSFTLNGEATNETETWKVGGAPADVANGVSLTLSGAMPAPAMPAPAPAAPAMPAPAPAATGNAGLLAEQGTSPWLMLGLAALALAMLAGVRAATGRVR